MEKIRIGINGFGRIGRSVLKQALGSEDFDVVGINDLADLGDLAYLLQYDSVHGHCARDISHDRDKLTVDGASIPFFSGQRPDEIPWGTVGADIVFECTGASRSRVRASGHLSAGARKVIVSAPSDDADAMLVCGVNADRYDPARHHVVSNASCTTNCVAPVAQVLLRAFGVEHMMITTVHAYTSSQTLIDTPMRKRRRGRAAALSIVPTTTGAARATARVLPELEGRIDGLALRVPVPDGSVIDVVALLQRDVTAVEVNQAFREAAARPPLQRVLRVSDEALVSCDIVGDAHSAIVDAESTTVLRRRAVKVVAWYDNEWGYAARLIDLARLIARAQGGTS
jgi:glyceraldehyde 3-phosphate dehydrogenase